MKATLTTLFQTTFGGSSTVFFAPGRINLMGDHIDYNGGNVLPSTISMGTYAAIAPREGRDVRLFSTSFVDAGIITCSLDSLQYRPEQGWANYPLGVIKTLGLHGYHIPTGFDVVFLGDLPLESALSSSASLEVLTAYMLSQLFAFSLSLPHLAEISKQAENEFIGMPCGILDQFAIAMGQPNSCIFLDTASMDYSYIPLQLPQAEFLIMNTKKRRELTASKYAQRRAECEHALADLQSHFPLTNLCDLTPQKFTSVFQLISDPICRRRAKHAVLENARTIEAATAVQTGDLTQLGLLLNQSHHSLQHDFDVSCDELNTLVETAISLPGVYGARMTGGGFGGCAIALVASQSIRSVTDRVGEIYLKKIGHSAEFYTTSFGGGPTVL